MMVEELIWKHDPRSIGIMEDDQYYPVIMIGFRVTAYISGPGTNWSGYEVKIQNTDYNIITSEFKYHLIRKS